MTAGEASIGLAPGEVVGGRYKVIDELGQGAMGTVYKVLHTEIEIELALKLLHSELSLVPSIEERFNREAKSAALLDNPHIVRVTDFGRSEAGALFMVMELLDGRPLGVVAEEEHGVDEVIDMIDQVLAALEHAHEHGVVHRDLKPDNVMIVERQGKSVVKILDFGLAQLNRASAEHQKLTQAGTVFGTPRYMSPEQATADKMDARSDIYSVGVMLYEFLAKRALFDGETVVEIMTKQVTQAPAPINLTEAGSYDPAALEAVVMGALEKRPEDRIQSATEFRKALREAKGRRSKKAPRPSDTGVADTLVRPDSVVALQTGGRRRALIGAFGLVAVLGAGGAAVYFGTQQEPLEAAQAAFADRNLKEARTQVGKHLALKPKDPVANKLLADIDFEEEKLGPAVGRYKAALAADPNIAEDEQFQMNVRRLIDRRDNRASELVEAVSRYADAGAKKFLLYLAQEPPHPKIRRLGYEGLERVDEADELDRFEYLSAQLEKNKSDTCEVRKWYVERLIPLEDERSLPLFEAELGRRGGFLGLESTSDCMRKLLKEAVDNLKNE